MATELFVYWKVDAALAAQAQAAGSALLQALRQRHTGLEARLMRRPGSAQGQVTFMETYRVVDGDVTAALQEDIEARASDALRAVGPPARHVERFEVLDPEA